MLKYLFNKTYKQLSKGKLSKGGRNFLGRVCVVGRGTLKQRLLLKKIDNFRRLNLQGFFFKICIDIKRTCKVGSILYLNGIIGFILLTKDLVTGTILYSGSYLPYNDYNLKEGDAICLKHIKLFSILSNIETHTLKGSKLIRAGGGSCIFIGKDKKKGILKLKSGWQLKISLNNMCTLGQMSNNALDSIKKAGKNRFLGFRPKVRGVAKNPCDHPHGGGNGKKSKPKIPVNALKTMFKWKHSTNKIKDKIKRRLFKKII